jgi:membrane-associated phospholipid phosphatase
MFLAVLIGQTKTFLKDWIPFSIILFAYQMMRGYADDLGFQVHIQELIKWELTLFPIIPTLYLQNRFYPRPFHFHWYDFLAFCFWAFHFVLPIFFAFLLWLKARTAYFRFIFSLIFLSFAGFSCYILFPAAPPWLASQKGFLPTVNLIRLDILMSLRFENPFSWIMVHGNPNHVAAMPSLHAAYPWLVFLFSYTFFRSYGAIFLIYFIGLSFSIIYLGDHYVVDILGGMLIASSIFLMQKKFITDSWLMRFNS